MIEDDQLSLDSTVRTTLGLLGLKHDISDRADSVSPKGQQPWSHSPDENSLMTNWAQKSEATELASPRDGLIQCQFSFDKIAAEKNFSAYWEKVAPAQDELLLAYICEAFEALGSNIRKVSAGQQVNTIAHISKHDRAVKRLLEILEKHSFVRRQGSILVRGSRVCPPKASLDLHQDFVSRFPSYAVEARLMALTGPELSKCLKGEADPKNLMFRGNTAQAIMEEYYTTSPMLSTLTEQLVNLIRSVTFPSRLLSAPVRILEVGAGFGGITSRLVEMLCTNGIPVEYLFTDVSALLVKRARVKFDKYKWMSFRALDMEQKMPEELQGVFDIVIGTNCVHATTERVESLRRLKTLLSKQGFIMLSEVTQVVDWYDIVFGLLDGWWLATDGSAYPLQPVESWLESFEAAGFDGDKTGYSIGQTQESDTQQLLVASNKHKMRERFSNTSSKISEVQTVVYKEIDATKIEADIFLPVKAPHEPMPVGT